MKFKKLGLLYKLPLLGLGDYGVSHTSTPRAIHIKDDIFRIYFSSRDEKNRSSVFFIDIDIIKKDVFYENHNPALTFGDDRTFYPDGISLGDIIESDNGRFFTFMGWNNPEDNHWFGELGLARILDDGSLEVVGDKSQPTLGVDMIDPISLSYPAIIKKDSTYEMWYGSTVSWKAQDNEEMVHIFKQAVSTNGINWTKTRTTFPFNSGVMQALSSPTFFEFRSEKHMLFSYRGDGSQTYRIGRAVYSDVDEKWLLVTNQPVVDISNEGWDSEMVEYPFSFEHKGKIYLLYNGNGFGKSGIGIGYITE
ncbi:hypothetical protein ACQEXU_12650 [Vibrio sp. TRT 21S02]|uniref:hypothetical protein n=1 Tax=Vibrio sp. TRT 21S02 TaxID=3418507 RepID=UPI003CEBBF45